MNLLLETFFPYLRDAKYCGVKCVKKIMAENNVYVFTIKLTTVTVNFLH